MPELPEVEAVASELRACCPGETVRSVTVRWPKWAHHGRIAKALPGRTIQQVDRRGKYLRFHCDNGGILVSHLRMTGRWLVDPDPVTLKVHVSAIVRMESGRTLAFLDVRKFGRAGWYAPDEPIPELEALGPEPLDPSLTAARLWDRMCSRRKQLKTLLLDQTFLAGLGNIYASELLFRAKLNPFVSSDEVTLEEARRIHQAMRFILRQAIREGGTTISDYRGARNQEGNFQNLLRVYQRAGEPCGVCRTPIARIVQGQRSTFFCPHCQSAPAILSPR